MASWFYSGASVVGKSHMTSSTPCQDKYKIQTSRDGSWLALVVCDGAGSAEFGEQGALITAEYFSDELIKLSRQLEMRPPGEWINDFVIECVLRVREQIRNVAKSDNIRDYHCTLVAALVGDSGGFSIHIGDGAIMGGRFSQSRVSETIELNSSFFISKPENGEYANETYFITEGNWVKHLRITPMPALDWIVACSDGGASLLLDSELQVKPKFLAPFLAEQLNKEFADNEYVQLVLGDPQANKLTTDDKTIVAAVRRRTLKVPVTLQFSRAELPPEAAVRRASMPVVQTAPTVSAVDTSSVSVSNPGEAAAKTTPAPQGSPSTRGNRRVKQLLRLAMIFLVGGLAFAGWWYRLPLSGWIQTFISPYRQQTPNSKLNSPEGVSAGTAIEQAPKK